MPVGKEVVVVAFVRHQAPGGVRRAPLELTRHARHPNKATRLHQNQAEQYIGHNLDIHLSLINRLNNQYIKQYSTVL